MVSGVQPRRKPNRHRIADKTARVWDAASGKECRLRGHEGLCGQRRSAPTGRASSPLVGQDGAGVGRRDAEGDPALRGHEGLCRPRRSAPTDAHRHRVVGQDRAGVGRGDRQADRRATRA